MKSYEEYEYELSIEAKHRPHCQCCGEPIWDNKYYQNENYAVMCDLCFDEWLETFKEGSVVYVD